VEHFLPVFLIFNHTDSGTVRVMETFMQRFIPSLDVVSGRLHVFFISVTDLISIPVAGGTVSLSLRWPDGVRLPVLIVILTADGTTRTLSDSPLLRLDERDTRPAKEISRPAPTCGPGDLDSKNQPGSAALSPRVGVRKENTFSFDIALNLRYLCIP
jgi:hypothetical protein